MKRFVLALAACIAFAAPALAMEEPVPSQQDSRIRSADYSPSNVIHITSTDLKPVQIVLQEGEQVASFAGLFVATASKPSDMKNVHDWFMRWSGNAIVLQPLKAEPASILFVDTRSPDGPMRHYRFQIDTRDDPPGNDPGDYDAVNMTYPEVIAAQRKAAWEAGAQARAKRRAEREEKVAAAEAEWRLKAGLSLYAIGRNWRYAGQNIGSDDHSCDVIGPERAAGISDDGIQTRLLFAPHATMPVPYVLDQDGKESVVAHSQDETAAGIIMTLHAVAPRVILRRGKRVCALTNMAYDPVGHQTGTGTAAADVVREVRQ